MQKTQMADLTYDQVKQADQHLVTVKFASPSAMGNVWQGTMTGILSDPFLYEDGRFSFNTTTEYQPGSYSHSSARPLGSEAGLVLNNTEVVEFIDRGERTDALTDLGRHEASREHALKALMDAEANLARAYANLTDLTAQEG